jgi:hypothetical protein
MLQLMKLEKNSAFVFEGKNEENDCEIAEKLLNFIKN